MSIGVRVKSARGMSGLSQRGLAKQVGMSAMAISKYERDLDVPSSGVLLRLAAALGVRVEYFLRPAGPCLIRPGYRRRASMPLKEAHVLLGRMQEWLERYLEAESLFPGLPAFHLPARLNRRVASLDQVEGVALDLRKAWDLGLDAIESLVEVLEDQGIKVGLVEAQAEFDALTFEMEDKAPVIVVKRDLPGDRQRFNLAHELGHLLLQPGDRVDGEKAAHRFAGAFLVPEQAARSELGNQRHTLGLYELHLLKHKYGLSMQGWIYRAKDLRIVSESAASQLFKQFRRRGWYREEPGDPMPREEPGRMKRLVLRALAEDLISQSRAAELLGVSLVRFTEEEAKQHGGFPVGLRA